MLGTSASRTDGEAGSPAPVASGPGCSPTKLYGRAPPDAALSGTRPRGMQCGSGSTRGEASQGARAKLGSRPCSRTSCRASTGLIPWRRPRNNCAQARRPTSGGRFIRSWTRRRPGPGTPRACCDEFGGGTWKRSSSCSPPPGSLFSETTLRRRRAVLLHGQGSRLRLRYTGRRWRQSSSSSLVSRRINEGELRDAWIRCLLGRPSFGVRLPR
jgi:hypothetical protein